MSEAFHPEKIKKDVANISVNTFLLAKVENKIAGYAKLRNDRTYDEFKDSSVIEMERIYILQQFQKHKVGKTLMDACIKFSMEQKYEWLWLGVNAENEKAIPFYKQYGFTVFGTKTFKLGNAIDSDLLMKLKL
jgi:ribosomal protein S18 acetylase RimI-like enzyme